VLFGWLALDAERAPDAPLAMLGLPVPARLAPWAALAITQVLMPRASFLGHLSGILAGLAVAWGAADWLTDYWLATGTALAAALAVLSLKANPAAAAFCGPALAALRLSPAFLAATGLGAGVDAIAALRAEQPPTRRVMQAGVLRVAERGVRDEDIGVQLPPAAAAAQQPQQPPARSAAAAVAAAFAGTWQRLRGLGAGGNRYGAVPTAEPAAESADLEAAAAAPAGSVAAGQSDGAGAVPAAAAAAASSAANADGSGSAATAAPR
jgi:hypothetical protein